MNKSFIISCLVVACCLFAFKSPEIMIGKKYNTLFKPTTIIAKKDTIKKCGKIFVKGTIKAQNGETMPGVNIIIEQYNIGTISDVNGNYVLAIPDSISKCKITISFIGYHLKEFLFDREKFIKTKKIDL